MATSNECSATLKSVNSRRGQLSQFVGAFIVHKCRYVGDYNIEHIIWARLEIVEKPHASLRENC